MIDNGSAIIVSGGTPTGKTTFLNALVREIPNEERLILIEDTPELVIDPDYSVGLVCVRGELGEARLQWVESCHKETVRWRPLPVRSAKRPKRTLAITAPPRG